MPFASVEEYINAQTPEMRRALRQVRSAIRKAVPGVTETIAYNMPTYKAGGVRLLHFAAWKEHYAVYVATKPLLESFRDELRRFDIDKGTIRFPLTGTVPERLIGRIAKFRAQHSRA